MLSNPHWDAPSMSSFQSWLETRDPQERYHYSDCQNCACAQYLKHIGKFEDRWLTNTQPGDAVSRMNSIAAGNLEANTGHTFGELLERVRAHRELIPA